MLRATCSPTWLIVGFMTLIVLFDRVGFDPVLGMGAIAGLLYLCLLAARPFRRASLPTLRRAAAPSHGAST